MNPISRFLISCGLFLIVLGVLWLGLSWLFGNKPIPLGKLPGDIRIERENFRFYFPLATSLIISLLGSLFLYLIQRLRK